MLRDNGSESRDSAARVYAQCIGVTQTSPRLRVVLHDLAAVLAEAAATPSSSSSVIDVDIDVPAPPSPSATGVENTTMEVSTGGPSAMERELDLEFDRAQASIVTDSKPSDRVDNLASKACTVGLSEACLQ